MNEHIEILGPLQLAYDSSNGAISASENDCEIVCCFFTFHKMSISPRKIQKLMQIYRYQHNKSRYFEQDRITPLIMFLSNIIELYGQFGFFVDEFKNCNSCCTTKKKCQV